MSLIKFYIGKSETLPQTDALGGGSLYVTNDTMRIYYGTSEGLVPLCQCSDDLSFINTLKRQDATVHTTQGVAIGNNSVSGSRAFSFAEHTYDEAVDKMVDEDTNEVIGKYYLISTAGIEVGMQYSVVLKNNFDLRGFVKEVHSNYILVDNYILPNTSSTTQLNSGSYLFFPKYPNLGDTTIGSGAISVGWSCHATSACAFSEGYNNISAGKYSHTEGRDCTAVYAAHGEGNKCSALGDASHAQNTETKAIGSNSTSMGYKTTANGESSLAIGRETKSNKSASFAGGRYSTADGVESIAFGESAKTSGKYSGAFGYNVHSVSDQSFTFGLNLNATSTNQTVVGANNKQEDSAQFIVGIGESVGYPKNAFTVHKDGTAWVKDKIYTGGTCMDDCVDFLAKQSDVDVKLDKISLANRIYATSPGGSQTSMSYVSQSGGNWDVKYTSGTIAQRDTHGCLRASSPTGSVPNQLVTVKYLTDNCYTLQTLASAENIIIADNDVQEQIQDELSGYGGTGVIDYVRIPFESVLTEELPTSMIFYCQESTHITSNHRINLVDADDNVVASICPGTPLLITDTAVLQSIEYIVPLEVFEKVYDGTFEVPTLTQIVFPFGYAYDNAKSVATGCNQYLVDASGTNTFLRIESQGTTSSKYHILTGNSAQFLWTEDSTVHKLSTNKLYEVSVTRINNKTIYNIDEIVDM